MTRVLGAVLAGGRSRRFGSDKAQALLDGRSLIDRVIERLDAQVEALVVCGREVAGVASIADRPGRDLGPLGGLNAALHYAVAHGFDAVLSVPCDTPFLPDDLVARLDAGGQSAFVESLPVIGLWPSTLADVLDRHLAMSGDRSMRRWAVVTGAVAVDVAPVANVNTTADLVALTPPAA